jgi:sugar lactone lactonase YvrE
MAAVARVVLVAAWVALVAGACSTVGREPSAEPPLVWPPAPDPPRVAFVTMFSRPGELGISPGLFARLADALLGGTDVRLVRPMAVVTVDDVLYVADPGVGGVHRFDRAKSRHALIRAPGGAPLPSPVALARGLQGDVYVSDSAVARVFVIRPDAKVAVPVPLRAALRQPTGIAFDPDGARLYVVDTAAHRVHVFGPDGTLDSTFGRRGTADGEFNHPTLIWRARTGALYVTDSSNFRVQILDAQGRFLGKFGRHGDGSGDLARHKGVATDRQGHVYVVDALFHAVQIFDDAGRLLLAVGALGQGRGEFWLPAGIFISDDDTIYVADSYNQRVQVFRYVGGAT